MNNMTISLLLAILLSTVGCVSRPDPISTRATITPEPAAGLPMIDYTSQKDVTILREEYDPETGNLLKRTDIQSVASAAAMAQEAREAVEVEARIEESRERRAYMETIQQALSNRVPAVPAPAPPIAPIGP